MKPKLLIIKNNTMLKILN